MKKNTAYSDIQLLSKVYMPNKKYIGEITAINNMASLVKISEPIFHVKCDAYPGGGEYFGLKYVQKMLVPC
jgi:hypothetical protein